MVLGYGKFEVMRDSLVRIRIDIGLIWKFSLSKYIVGIIMFYRK